MFRGAMVVFVVFNLINNIPVWAFLSRFVVSNVEAIRTYKRFFVIHELTIFKGFILFGIVSQ